MPKPKLGDVAALAGVSPTTVSRVLNNRGYLSEATRVKVFDAMQQLDYRPNAIARSLQGQKSQLIGLVFPSVANPFYGEMAYRIESHLADIGYKTILCNSNDHPESEQRYLDMLIANQVDGVITGAHSQVVANFPHLGAPLVTIDRSDTGRGPNISCDNEAGAHQATQLLIDGGARNLLHITSTRSEANRRQQGYLRAVSQAEVPHSVLALGFTTAHHTKQETIINYLDANPQVDGIFASNDVYAAMVLNYANRAGRAVPGDLQVVGFDGTEYTRSLLPKLTTVVQPIDAIAQRAVAQLVHAMNDPEKELTGSNTLPVSIHPGGTVRNPQLARALADPT
ncbi:LacI family DNA-binding transcriptional regulator [Rothia nasisuis]|uniref:LacI family DNA-binding transcriptional regulator n=1 Tax=Rothia nasisuis TaxID=2109647 RepID=UPI001F375680|nr:LacI family DNA-binding transcriptional regulator [Rothia nasisuis]